MGGTTSKKLESPKKFSDEEFLKIEKNIRDSIEKGIGFPCKEKCKNKCIIFLNCDNFDNYRELLLTTGGVFEVEISKYKDLTSNTNLNRLPPIIDYGRIDAIGNDISFNTKTCQYKISKDNNKIIIRHTGGENCKSLDGVFDCNKFDIQKQSITIKVKKCLTDDELKSTKNEELKNYNAWHSNAINNITDDEYDNILEMEDLPPPPPPPKIGGRKKSKSKSKSKKSKGKSKKSKSKAKGKSKKSKSKSKSKKSKGKKYKLK
jgi:hypothetical protein